MAPTLSSLCGLVPLLIASARAVTLVGNSTGPKKVSWQGDDLHMTHYWDCSGQGCDAATLQPWDESRYVSPPGYGPQDPGDFGGPAYGETMWLTGAASDALSALMGPDDGCCGTDPNDGGVGGCGKCVLVQNPDSLHPEWTAVVMKKSRCPPWSNGCGEGMPHLDIAAPGFDNLQYSTANVCGKKAGTGFESQMASEAVGRWYEKCKDTAECIDLCSGLEPGMRKGCQLFAKWGWKRGDPKNIRYTAVECPLAFVKHIGSLFGPKGPQEASVVSSDPSTQPSPTIVTTTVPSTTAAVSAAPASSIAALASSTGPASTTMATSSTEEHSTTGVAVTTPAASSTAIASSTVPESTEEESEPATVQPHEPEGKCLSMWTQCGGEGWQGHSSCCPGLECHVDNPWWSVCIRSAPKAAQPEKAKGRCLAAWTQCGGEGWKGQGSCCEGLRCHRDNPWWSVCLPGASLAEAPTTGTGAQRGSFLAPAQRHVLREAPAFVQSGSMLSRSGMAPDVFGKLQNGDEADEL